MVSLHDIIVRHQVYIEGLKLGTAKNFTVTAAELDKSIRAELADLKYSDLGELSRRKLAELLSTLKGIARRVFNAWLTRLIAFLEDFTQDDLELLTGVFRSSGLFGELPDDLDPEREFKAIWGLPMAATGMTALAFLNNFTASSVVRLDRAVTGSWAQHDSPAALARIIGGTREANYRDGLISRFSRESAAASDTVIQHISAQLIMKAAGVNQYEWVSVLDDKTTKICRGRDGKIYIVGKGPLPPAHIRCRSSVRPYIGAKSPDETFSQWGKRQPSSVIKDMFDGRVSSSYEGTRALTLAQFKAKRGFILAE